MSQIYPTPALALYRIVAWGSDPSNQTGVTVGGVTYGAESAAPVWFKIEYSKNSGSTWLPASNMIFNSAIDAYAQIAQIVNQEASFINSASLQIPNNTILPYPI